MNIAIAFLLGLMVSLGLVFLLEYLDNTYKNKEQLEKELDIPVLGVIPDVDIFLGVINVYSSKKSKIYSSGSL